MSHRGPEAPIRPTESASDPALVWVAPIYEATGYADEARGLLAALEASGLPVALRAVAERQVAGFREQLPPWVRGALERQAQRRPRAPFAVVQHFPADGFVPTPLAHRQIGRTMFETDGLPPSWVARCNAMDALWVPSHFNREAFQRAGVRVPIRVVPGGVDSLTYRPDGNRSPIAEARGCVFLSIFEWRRRKGWDVLLRAWAEAFGPQDDVTLVLRCSVPGRPANADTAQWLRRTIDGFLQDALGRPPESVAPIVILPDLVTAADLPALYRAATAYVSPTRGEGWGRPFMEAMATGLPVIATRWSAHLDYMDDATSLLVDVDRLVPAHDPDLPVYEGTRWAEPSVRDLVRQLRRVSDDRAGAAQIGARAREAMQSTWRWEQAAHAVRAAWEELAPAMRAPRTGTAAAVHPCRMRPFASTPDAAATSATPRLWFAMLTYNALAYTRRALASLDRHTDAPWQLLILDNGSTDGTREWLATLDDPRIEVAYSATNRGVAGGRNDCVARLLERVPPDGWIVFIDNDLEFYPHWLDAYRPLLDRPDPPGIVSSSGFEIVVHAEHRELLSFPALVPLSVDVASGGFACAVRPAVFTAIGGYDEQLNPFWHEDDDLSVRTRAAGFDVVAVPHPGIVHHGHKSGAAIPALVHGGSRSKQAYLVQKWRDAGWVADDGHLRPGRSDGGDGVGAAMATVMGRPQPLLGSEVRRAALDVAQVERARRAAPSGGAGGRDLGSGYATAPALAWAEVMADRADPMERGRWRDVRDELREVLATRRRLTRLPVGDGSPVASGLADARHWDDDAWFAAAVEAAGDGRGRLQWFDRSAAVWDATQVARAVARAIQPAGNRERAPRLLVLGDLRRPIVWHLATLAESVVVGDVLTRHGASPGAARLDHAERFALREVPAGRVEVVDLEAVADTISAGSVDIAVILPWDPHAAAPDIAALLGFVRDRLAPGGWACATLPVRLAGAPDPSCVDSPARLENWLARVGYRSLDLPTVAMSDQGLLAAADGTGPAGRTPDLLRMDGGRLVGRLFVTATPTTDAC